MGREAAISVPIHDDEIALLKTTQLRLSERLTDRRCAASEAEIEQAVFLTLAASCFADASAISGDESQYFESVVPEWRLQVAVLSDEERDLLRNLARFLGPAPESRLATLFEGLLSHRLCRLRGSAVCLRPAQVWLPLTELLKVEANDRSIHLRRHGGISAATGRELAGPLSNAKSCAALQRALAPVSIEHSAQTSRWVVQPSLDRRRSGSHYTPASLAGLMVQRCLSPLLEPLVERGNTEALLALRFLDPAMGAGAFLITALDYMTDAVLRANAPSQSLSKAQVRAMIGSRCLYGVDLDPRATLLAQLSVLRRAPGADLEAIREHLRHGNGLGENPFTHLHFDGVLGNPPWIAYVGRAAQPLRRETAEYYQKTFSSFRKYRTLHGLFVERSARWLSPGGRLGLVLPTSTADLSGYAPTRQAHNELCDVDPELPDFGDGAFAHVFQPCMGLLSTRRERQRGSTGEAWPLARTDLTEAAAALLARLGERPKMPPESFGERGYQTRPDDRERLVRISSPLQPNQVPIRTGSEVVEFQTLPPRWCVRPAELSVPLRPEAGWRQISLLIRQTARYPIASVADGVPFRNSLLAGFDSQQLPSAVLLGWLNSDAVRWFHFHKQRDARQGMPQLKVAHLRALPAPPDPASANGRALAAFCEELAPRNDGIRAHERRKLNDIVAGALELSEAEFSLIAGWAEANPPPVPRNRGRSERR